MMAIAAFDAGKAFAKITGGSMALGICLYLIPRGMIAIPTLFNLPSEPLAAMFVYVKIGVGLGALSYGIIAPQGVMVRLVRVTAGLISLFI